MGACASSAPSVRVRVERSGTKKDGNAWNRASMLNIVLKVGKDVYPGAAKVLTDLVKKYKDVITMPAIAKTEKAVKHKTTKQVTKITKAMKKKPKGRY